MRSVVLPSMGPVLRKQQFAPRLKRSILESERRNNMADPAPAPPTTPTGAMAPPQAPGGFDPSTVKANQLDAPLRTRVLSTGPAQPKPADPFSGLGFVDVLQVRAAMQDRLTALSTDPANNQTHIESTKRVLALAQQKLAPRAPQEGMTFMPAMQIPATAQATGTAPIPPLIQGP
jgi:hypothetical protein